MSRAAQTSLAPLHARTSSPKRNKWTLYRFAGWELDMRTRCLRSPQGAPVALTRGELSLLAAFLSAPERVLSRDELLDLSHVHDNEVFDRSLDVQILRLRRKIETNPGEPELIKRLSPIAAPCHIAAAGLKNDANTSAQRRQENIRA